MSLSRKKVIVRKWNRDWLAGYLPSSGFVHGAQVELLDLGGKVTALPLGDVKWICFVRDFNSGEAENPERLLRKTFAGRPRSEGVWLRLQLTDADTIEGIAANDLTLFQSSGISLVPPDIRSNTQRLFIPHSSLQALELVAIISAGSRKKVAAAPEQESLFQ